MSTKVYATKSFVKAGLPRNGVFTATAEIHSISEQSPYFSITADLKEGSRDVAGGCMHDEVREYFPQLAKYIRWHLTSGKEPLHYIPNALYHAGFCKDMEDARNIEYLKSTVVYGALESDMSVDLEKLNADALKSFLTNRYDALMDQFTADMSELFGEEVFKKAA